MVKHKHVLEYGTTVVYTMEGEAGGGGGGGAGEWATQLGGWRMGTAPCCGHHGLLYRGRGGRPPP